MDHDAVLLQLQETKDRSLRNEGRIKKLEKRQEDLDQIVGAIREMANEQEHMKTDLSEIKVDVRAMADKPRKRVEKIVDNLLWLLIGGVAAYVLTQAGLPM